MPSLHGWQYNGSFHNVHAKWTFPSGLFALLSVVLIKARVRLHGCQRRCKLVWGLCVLIPGSSDSPFILHPCSLYPSKSSLPLYIWAVCQCGSDWTPRNIFLPSFVLKLYQLRVASVKPGPRFFVSVLHCVGGFAGERKKLSVEWKEKCCLEYMFWTRREMTDSDTEDDQTVASLDACWS